MKRRRADAAGIGLALLGHLLVGGGIFYGLPGRETPQREEIIPIELEVVNAATAAPKLAVAEKALAKPEAPAAEPEPEPAPEPAPPVPASKPTPPPPPAKAAKPDRHQAEDAERARRAAAQAAQQQKDREAAARKERERQAQATRNAEQARSREASAQADRQKAERERQAREASARTAREKAAREKAAREASARAASEKAAREKAAREASARAAREKVERERLAREAAAREAATQDAEARRLAAIEARKNIKISLGRAIEPYFKRCAPSGFDVNLIGTQIDLHIRQNGSLEDVVLHGQTGINENNTTQAPLLRECALKAARSAAPFASLPTEFYDVWKVWKMTLKTR